MRCCLFTFFFMCVVVFVQIRLRQQRDALKFPLKFAVTYAVEGQPIKKTESTQLKVVKERLLYGTPNVKIKNHTLTSLKGIDVSCYIKVQGEPLTFHTVTIYSESTHVASATVILNTIGVGHVFLKHDFFHLNPFFEMTHTFDNHLTRSSDGKATASGFIEIRNLPIVLDKEIGLQWIQV